MIELVDATLVLEWFNYFLFVLDLMALWLLVQYIIEIKKSNGWGIGWLPHVQLVAGFICWIVGVTILRVASIVRINVDALCYGHQDCIAGGYYDIVAYRVGVTLSAIGLLNILRVAGVYYGRFAWLKMVIYSTIVATVMYLSAITLRGR